MEEGARAQGTDPCVACTMWLPFRGHRLQRMDEGGIDGDLCGLLTTPGSSVAALVWPTAEKLPELKKLAEVGTLRGYVALRFWVWGARDGAGCLSPAH